MRHGIIAALLVPGLALAWPAANAQTSAHAQHADHAAHAAHAGASTQAAPAQRWATDAPLRAGMREIRAATGILVHYQAGHLDARRGNAAVARIDAAIKDMIANCKLAPQADAALHGLLAKFMAGADAVRAGRFTQAELTAMQAALARYPQLFNDPGWSGR
ncbi:MAG: DnrO protein [Thermomonas sp.]|uniref:DnrO protein n=1 Tax=Thermomonas sp. TaxID=1971895 RepID=UPI001DC7008E|nr:DnrO protein [Thermomonas sp.]MBZ0088549.1 DnrO protein [Thermomonas sp.]MCO5054436.1 DnrO protein [Thermomonas sp.]